MSLDTPTRPPHYGKSNASRAPLSPSRPGWWGSGKQCNDDEKGNDVNEIREAGCTDGMGASKVYWMSVKRLRLGCMYVCFDLHVYEVVGSRWCKLQ